MSQLTVEVYSYLKEIDFLTAINSCNHLINWKSSNSTNQFQHSQKQFVVKVFSFIVTSSDHAVANSEHILGRSLHPQQRRSKKKS